MLHDMEFEGLCEEEGELVQWKSGTTGGGVVVVVLLRRRPPPDWHVTLLMAVPPPHGREHCDQALVAQSHVPALQTATVAGCPSLRLPQ